MKGNVQQGTHIAIQVRRPSLLKFHTQTWIICDTNTAHFGAMGN